MHFLSVLSALILLELPCNIDIEVIKKSEQPRVTAHLNW